jgi:hypothetical protein
MRDIKKVLESQGNMQNMVEVQANLECRSLTLSPTRSPGTHAFKLTYMMHLTSDLRDLQMRGKIRREPFQCHWSHGQLKSESAAIIKTRQITRTLLVLHHLFWAAGLCIKLESVRDTS